MTISTISEKKLKSGQNDNNNKKTQELETTTCLKIQYVSLGFRFLMVPLSILPSSRVSPTVRTSSFLQSNWKLQCAFCKSWIKLLDCKLDCKSARSNFVQNFGPETCPTRSSLRWPLERRSRQVKCLNAW